MVLGERMRGLMLRVLSTQDRVAFGQGDVPSITCDFSTVLLLWQILLSEVYIVLRSFDCCFTSALLLLSAILHCISKAHGLIIIHRILPHDASRVYSVYPVYVGLVLCIKVATYTP